MATAIQGRQWPLAAGPVSFGIANTGTGNGFTVEIPVGGFVTAIVADVVTAFNAGTTNTVTIGDGTTTFANGVTTGSAGLVTVSSVPKYYPNGGTITVSGAQTGTAATAGLLIFEIDYVVLNRANEVLTN